MQIANWPLTIDGLTALNLKTAGPLNPSGWSVTDLLLQIESGNFTIALSTEMPINFVTGWAAGWM